MYRSILAFSAVAGELLLATTPASAQSYGYSYDYSGPANEEVIITAPRTPQFREQGSSARSRSACRFQKRCATTIWI